MQLALQPFVLKAGKELIPNIQKSALKLSLKVKIRSQLSKPEKENLEKVFLCSEEEDNIHILNAISTACTVSFEPTELIINHSGH